MILKGSQRGGATQLAHHLLKTEENEHVEIHEISGFVSEDLHGAFKEIQAVSQGTRCKQFMFSVSLNPPQDESAPVEYFEKAITGIEKELGLEGQPRAVVFHEKEGRRHCHTVWSRIDTDEMKAINLSYYKFKLREVSRQLYFQYGWDMPRGLMNTKERNPFNYSLAQWQHAKRLGEDPKDLKKLFQDCWAASDNKQSFERALNDYGMYLAKGDRRGYVAIDHRGEVFSLSRWINVKTKALKQRLGSPESLPSISAVKAEIGKRITGRLKSYIRQVQDQLKHDLQPFIDKKQALKNHHQNERVRLQQSHEKRWEKESLQRSKRIPKGLKAIWYRMTGKYKTLRNQNERENESCRSRDRDEKQKLIERQLKEGQKLQRQIRPIVQEHRDQFLRLKQDIAKYLEMESPSSRTLQEELGYIHQDKDVDYSPEM